MNGNRGILWGESKYQHSFFCSTYSYLPVSLWLNQCGHFYNHKKKTPHKTQWMHFKIKEFYKLHVLRIFWILTKHKLDTSQINCIHGSTACSMLCRVTSLFLSQCLSQSGHWVKRSELSLLQGEKCGWKSVGISRCYGTFQHFRVTLFFLLSIKCHRNTLIFSESR